MARELVLLSDVPLTADLMAATAAQVIPDGVGIEYRDGEVTQFVDATGAQVLTIFDPVAVHVPDEARAMLKDPPLSFALWTELTVPFEASAAARPLAEALARSVRGVVREKL